MSMRMRMRMRSRRRLASEINVVPYIDVMLVLLVIFMITVPFLTTGVKVDLPDAQARTININKKKRPIILTVKADGALYLNIGNGGDSPLTPKAVRRMTAHVLERRPDTPVFVRGDGDGDYANVVRAMILLQQAGAGKVGLLTDNIASAADRHAFEAP